MVVPMSSAQVLITTSSVDEVPSAPTATNDTVPTAPLRPLRFASENRIVFAANVGLQLAAGVQDGVPNTAGS
jgi:hypothetical protein